MNQAQTTLLVLYATAIKFPSTPTLGTNFLTVTNCLGEKGASNDHNSTHQLKDDERQCLSTGCHGVRAESAVQIWDSSTQQCQTCGWELPIFFLFFFPLAINKPSLTVTKTKFPWRAAASLPASVQSTPLASALPLLPPASAHSRTAFQPENNHPSTSLIFLLLLLLLFFLQTVS